jgi:hypothetical protein
VNVNVDVNVFTTTPCGECGLKVKRRATLIAGGGEADPSMFTPPLFSTLLQHPFDPTSYKKTGYGPTSLVTGRLELPTSSHRTYLKTPASQPFGTDLPKKSCIMASGQHNNAADLDVWSQVLHLNHNLIYSNQR